MDDPSDPEHRALLAGVRAAPRDDAPRLVLADWYDERGLAELAAFVRWQVGHRRSTAGLEWPRFGTTANCWFREDRGERPPPDLVPWFSAHALAATVGYSADWAWTWHRGFVARLALPADDALDCLGPLLAAWPITTVRLTAPLSFAYTRLLADREQNVGRGRRLAAGMNAGRTGGTGRPWHALNVLFPTVRFREFCGARSGGYGYANRPRDARGRWVGAGAR